MVDDSYELESAKLRNLDEVIEGATYCMKGRQCSKGPFHCPYWNPRRKRCSGDFRKDLLQWVKILKKKAEL